MTSDGRPSGQDCGWEEASSSYLEEGVRKLGSGQNICTIHPSPSHHRTGGCLEMYRGLTCVFAKLDFFQAGCLPDDSKGHQEILETI